LSLVGTGAVIPDDAAIAACTAALEQTTSDCVAPASCRSLWKGTREIGQPCIQAVECNAGAAPAVCLFVYSADGAAPSSGICQAATRGAGAGACQGSCSPGTDCSVTVVTPEPSPSLALCYSDDGLFCDSSTQQCAPIVASGADCGGVDEACGPTGYCDSTCTARKAAGQACTFSSECSARDGLVCVSGTCNAPFVSASVCAADYH
jgi:hypothetical protein